MCIRDSAYSLTSGSNYGCAVDGEGPGVTDSVLGESGLNLDYEVTCDACVSNPPDEWASSIPQADCSLWMSGTPVLDMNTEAPKATHCGPIQGSDGCIYPLEFED